jgi:hypothetical protein
MIGGGELGDAFYYGCAFIKRKRPGAFKLAQGLAPAVKSHRTPSRPVLEVPRDDMDRSNGARVLDVAMRIGLNVRN